MESVAQQLFGETNYFWDYKPIVNSFGKIIIQVNDGDYQEDSYILLEDDGRYGYLSFGWGSCSGCDALQACSWK